MRKKHPVTSGEL